LLLVVLAVKLLIFIKTTILAVSYADGMADM